VVDQILNLHETERPQVSFPIRISLTYFIKNGAHLNLQSKRRLLACLDVERELNYYVGSTFPTPLQYALVYACHREETYMETFRELVSLARDDGSGLCVNFVALRQLVLCPIHNIVHIDLTLPMQAQNGCLTWRGRNPMPERVRDVRAILDSVHSRQKAFRDNLPNQFPEGIPKVLRGLIMDYVLTDGYANRRPKPGDLVLAYRPRERFAIGLYGGVDVDEKSPGGGMWHWIYNSKSERITRKFLRVQTVTSERVRWLLECLYAIEETGLDVFERATDPMTSDPPATALKVHRDTRQDSAACRGVLTGTPDCVSHPRNVCDLCECCIVHCDCILCPTCFEPQKETQKQCHCCDNCCKHVCRVCKAVDPSQTGTCQTCRDQASGGSKRKLGASVEVGGGRGGAKRLKPSE
jgi:hypothetical protein